MPSLTPIERERVRGMLHANMASSIIAQQFRCHVRTIERLGNRFRQTGTTSDSPRPERRRVTTRRQDRHIRTTNLRNPFIPATVTVRTTPGTHNQRISDFEMYSSGPGTRRSYAVLTSNLVPHDNDDVFNA